MIRITIYSINYVQFFLHILEINQNTKTNSSPIATRSTTFLVNKLQKRSTNNYRKYNMIIPLYSISVLCGSSTTSFDKRKMCILCEIALREKGVLSWCDDWHPEVSVKLTTYLILYDDVRKDLPWYPFWGLYFCRWSFMCLHREPYVAPGGSQCKNNPWPAVQQIYSRNGRHLPPAILTSWTKHVSHRGRAVQGFPTSAVMVFQTYPAS